MQKLVLGIDWTHTSCFRWAVVLPYCAVYQWRGRDGRQAAMHSRLRWELLWETYFYLQRFWLTQARKTLLYVFWGRKVTSYVGFPSFSQGKSYLLTTKNPNANIFRCSFTGYFDQQLRQNLFISWASHLQQANIQFRPDIARVEVSNPTTVNVDFCQKQLEWSALN